MMSDDADVYSSKSTNGNGGSPGRGPNKGKVQAEDESKTVDGILSDREAGKDCPILGAPLGADGRLTWVVDLIDPLTKVHGVILHLAKQNSGMNHSLTYL